MYRIVISSAPISACGSRPRAAAVVVEKIYMSDIGMRNIGGATILFDMYYMGKDPLAMFAGSDEAVIAPEPVNEGTPQFRATLHVKNVVCKGAGIKRSLSGDCLK